MAVTASPRLGVTRWSSGADPFNRAQLDGDHGTLDNLTAIDATGTLAARPAAGIRGRYYFATDNNALYRDTGTAWVLVGGPDGVLGYAQVVANQTGIGATEVDLTSLTVTVTVAAGRRVKLSSQMMLQNDATAGTPFVRFKEGTTDLGRVTYEESWAANRINVVSGSVVLSPSAGSHTYKLTGMKFIGAGTFSLIASSVNPAFLLAEDIGLA